MRLFQEYLVAQLDSALPHISRPYGKRGDMSGIPVSVHGPGNEAHFGPVAVRGCSRGIRVGDGV